MYGTPPTLQGCNFCVTTTEKVEGWGIRSRHVLNMADYCHRSLVTEYLKQSHFLVAEQIYIWSCLSVRLSVRPSVCLSQILFQISERGSATPARFGLVNFLNMMFFSFYYTQC